MRIFFILIIIFISGCSNSKKWNKTELLDYINDEDNHLKKEQRINGLDVSLIYRPSSLLVLQELEGGEGSVNNEMMKLIENKYNSHYYFTLKLSKDKKEAIRELGNFSNYSSMLQVLAFNMQNYVTLTAGTDTVPVADYYFDQTYGMSNGNTVLLSFSKSNIKTKNKIFIHVGECGLRTGNIVFEFDRKDLDEVPLLDYSSAN